MDKKIIKKCITFFVLIIFVLCFSIPVFCYTYANSAQTYWQGVTASGAIITDKECPLQVVNENLIFEIPEFPNNYYDNSEDYLNYSANVSAEYTFYNPSDMLINATLVFPFGVVPDYAYYDYDSENNEAFSDVQKYDIKVDQKPIQKKLRYTYYNGMFQLNDIDKLRKDYNQEFFFKKDLLVTQYVYQIPIVSNNTIYASTVLPCNTYNTKILFSKSNGYSYDGKSKEEIGTFVNSGEQIIIYAIGEPLEENQIPKFTLYESGNKKKILQDNICKIDKSIPTQTFLEFSKKYLPLNTDISEIDWYNAVVDSIYDNMAKENDYYFLNKAYIGNEYNLQLEKRLLRWYEYEIEVSPKSQIINTVCAPIYPDINLDYSSPIYNYNYLLSPAKNWSSFENLNISVKTPYYMLYYADKDFIKDDGQYNLNLKNLPDSELSFCLSLEENPTKNKPRFHRIIVIITACLTFIGISFIMLPVLVIIITIILTSRKNNKNNK